MQIEEIIEGVSLSNMCDYTFGDQASIVCHIYDGFMKPANSSNVEFINKLTEISKYRNYMTLFIDNIRLYKRELFLKNAYDQNWVNNLMNENDLLKLCAQFSEMNFIIFTNLEDTPIDSQIEGKIPENVKYIYAANAVYHNNKVIPAPYGIQRKFYLHDNRISILINKMDENILPNKLLYVNHNISNNISERSNINELFVNRNWVTVNSDRVDYNTFLSKIKEHKFMICPIGNAVDCHRNWEVLYMRRVPIMKKNEYLEFLLKDFPVLFVNEYSEITEDLLIKNEFLYINALNMDLNNLNGKSIWSIR